MTQLSKLCYRDIRLRSVRRIGSWSSELVALFRAFDDGTCEPVILWLPARLLEKRKGKEFAAWIPTRISSFAPTELPLVSRVIASALPAPSLLFWMWEARSVAATCA